METWVFEHPLNFLTSKKLVINALVAGVFGEYLRILSEIQSKKDQLVKIEEKNLENFSKIQMTCFFAHNLHVF